MLATLASIASGGGAGRKDESLFRESELTSVLGGSIKVLPGFKSGDAYSSPVLIVTKAVRCDDKPQWVSDNWIRVQKGVEEEGSAADDCCKDCEDCGKGCGFCIFNCLLCGIPGCVKSCNEGSCCKCLAGCCEEKQSVRRRAWERREFGMTSYSMHIPLNDVVQITSTVRVLKRDDNSGQSAPKPGNKVAPESVRVGNEDVLVHPEQPFNEAARKCERHVVVRIHYLPNGNRSAASSIQAMTPEDRSAAMRYDAESPAYIDISLMAGNDWQSAEFASKCAEAEMLVQMIGSLKAFICATGRNPSPEEVLAASRPGIEAVSVSGIPPRPELMTYA